MNARRSSGPILLTKQTSWYGAYSGYYEQLPRFIGELDPATRVVRPRARLLNRLIGKVYSMSRGWRAPRNQSVSASERVFRQWMDRRPGAICHILAMEDHLWFLDEWEKAPRNLVGTIHFPRGLWKEKDIEYLRRLSSAIVLYRADISFFEEIVGPERVAFIRHGVHTGFFAPGQPVRNRLLFCGQFLRNTQMLARVARKIATAHKDVELHMVITQQGLQEQGLASLAPEPWVRLHIGIGDDQLRELLSTAYLMLIPFERTGANNAIVEALASGLPIVTTDIGGIRDYGGGTIYPLVANNDDDGMVRMVEDYFANPRRRNEVGAACRRFAEEHLAWELIARQHLDHYEQLLQDRDAAVSAQ